jgi:hypothetical protein
VSHSVPLLRIEIPLDGDPAAARAAAAALLRLAAAALEESGVPGLETGDECGVLTERRGAGPIRGEWAIQPAPLPF